MTVKILADLQDSTVDGWCLNLQHEGVSLRECAERLGLKDGQRVTLYYTDDLETVEHVWDGVLAYRPYYTDGPPHWMAMPDEATYRAVPKVPVSPELARALDRSADDLKHDRIEDASGLVDAMKAFVADHRARRRSARED